MMKDMKDTLAPPVVKKEKMTVEIEEDQSDVRMLQVAPRIKKPAKEARVTRSSSRR